MLWIIHCVSKPNTEAIRERTRDAHIKYLDENIKSGRLVFSGPTLSDDGNSVTGALYLVGCGSREGAMDFSASEPYTMAGIFQSVSITRTRKGKWNPGAIDG